MMALNMLVVDDSATMRAMVKKTLAMSGLAVGEIHEASNGREGLEVLDREWVDIVFIDINMPVMGGIEMIDALRKIDEHRDLPIVVVSTESSQTRIEEVRQKGIEFIHKPFTPERVCDVVQKLVGGLENGTG
jgi:two-component system chemotaxis response regulator CheY